MNGRAPDLECDLSGHAHPSRSARKEMRRFLATRAIALVQDAGVAITEVVRALARHHTERIVLRAWYDEETRWLRVEVVDGAADVASEGFPVVAALASSWGAAPAPDGSIVWFEMRGADAAHQRGGRTA